MPVVSDGTRRALLSLRALSPHLDVWSLAGDRNRMYRQDILAAILGRKVTKAESGVTAIRSALYEALGVVGGWAGERDEDFRAKALVMLGGGA